MIVMKFGGTSVEDAPAMKRVIGIVEREVNRKPLVVLSASAGVTNELLKIARTASESEEVALKLWEGLHSRQRGIAEGLLTGDPLRHTLYKLDEMFKELRNYVHGIHLLGELTNRSLDAFASLGERCSTLIFNTALQQAGFRSILVPANEIIITDDRFTCAQPQFDMIVSKAKELILSKTESFDIMVTQGFIGSTLDGRITTIGRGGSDYSAAIFGAALDVDEIQIWTDVDGMMTADPRIVSNPRRVEVMSFDEAAELAYFGAKVLHPNTIYPAVQKNIPVRVLNSRAPQIGGTLILAKLSAENQGAEVVKSIAFKKGITVINIASSRMLMAHGFLARLFTIFADQQKSIDVVSTSEVSVSVTIDNEDGLENVRKELEKIGDVGVTRGKAIICIVGEGMKQTPGIAGRIFSALAKSNVNIEMVSEGASEINLTIVVSEEQVTEAVCTLHDEFFPERKGGA